MGTCWKVYCDESRQDQSRFRLMGAVFIKTSVGQEFVDEYFQICDSLPGCRPRHLKWGKVPKRQAWQFQWYELLVNQFVRYNISGDIWFKVIVAEDYSLAHPIFTQGDGERGFYNLYHLLLLRALEQGCIYDLRVASREVSKKVVDASLAERLATLQSKLNAKFRTDTNTRRDVVRSVEARDEKDRLLIQLADVLMGAVGYHWNREDQRPGASPGKISLIEHICHKLQKPTLRFKTSSSDRVFNVYHFDPNRQGAHMST